MHCSTIFASQRTELRLWAVPAGRWLRHDQVKLSLHRWQLPPAGDDAKAACCCSYEEHVDWVNDIALVGPLLVSCSSDRSIKLWRATGASHAAAMRTASLMLTFTAAHEHIFGQAVAGTSLGPKRAAKCMPTWTLVYTAWKWSPKTKVGGLRFKQSGTSAQSCLTCLHHADIIQHSAQ